MFNGTAPVCTFLPERKWLGTANCAPSGFSALLVCYVAQVSLFRINGTAPVCNSLPAQQIPVEGAALIRSQSVEDGVACCCWLRYCALCVPTASYPLRLRLPDKRLHLYTAVVAAGCLCSLCSEVSCRALPLCALFCSRPPLAAVSSTSFRQPPAATCCHPQPPA